MALPLPTSVGGSIRSCVSRTERKTSVEESAPGIFGRSGLQAQIIEVGEAFWMGRGQGRGSGGDGERYSRPEWPGAV